MSAPASGGRSFSLAPGDPAQLLTQYAGGPDDPLLIINLNVAGPRVYIGADTSLTAANGVPIDPGTSLPWTTPGTVYAIADPAGSSNASLVITTAIGEWTPSPVAIAAAVLAEGVPLVLVEKTLLPTRALNGAINGIDISTVSELIIIVKQNTNKNVALVLEQTAGGLDVDVDNFNLSAVAPQTYTLRLAAQGDTLNITNATVPLDNITVIGTNRTPVARYDDRMQASSGYFASTNAVLVAGTNYPLDGGTVAKLQGLCFLDCGIDSATVTGYFALVTDGPLANVVRLMDTAEMFAASGAANKRGSKLVAVPGDWFHLEFRCRGTGSGGANQLLNATLIPAVI